VYVSVVFGELINNLDWFDKFDELRAMYGDDASVGFAQVKVSTAMWLEEGGYMPRSIDKTSLIKSLVDTVRNIAYSTMYVSLIVRKLSGLDLPIPKIRIIASYYAKGIDHASDSCDVNYVNELGLVAEQFYFSDDLITLFPRSQNDE